MQSSSQGRYQGYQGYQGYPYANPAVTDIPTVDAATASKWANLPRRPLQLPNKGTAGGSGAGSSSQSQQPTSSSEQVPPKKDPDENPVVYIDLPEAGSEVSQSIDTPGSGEPEFVQDTIMYDPFENRRIDRPKEDGGSMSSESESTYSDAGAYSRGNTGPPRPNTLNLASPSGSSTQSPASSSRNPPSIPSFMSKESLVYGGDGANGFPLSPIPVSEFPQPPPAYTEVATPQTPAMQEPVRTTVVQQPMQIVAQPPRTQVTYNPHPVNMLGEQYKHRKNLICHFCGIRVHTLVVKEIGFTTHVIALCVFILCMPLVVYVYLTDIFKHKNHYCPNCNRLIGYVRPLLGPELVLAI